MLPQVVVAAAALIALASAYPTGAPPTACPTLAPLHPNISAQPTRSPYEIATTSRYYEPGKPVIVTIYGPTFAGFILQARPIGGNSAAGSFISDLPQDTRYANCSINMNDTVTHANPSDKRNLDFVWIAPNDDVGTLLFQGAVLFNYSTFWKVSSIPIKSAKSVPCLVEREAIELQMQKTPTKEDVLVPQCTDDGMYQAKQCTNARCTCVDAMGQALESGRYAVDRSSADDMQCTCARDKDAYRAKGLIGRSFNCDGKGNYARTQCLGSVCFCADPLTGKQVPGSPAVRVGELANIKC